MFLTKKAKNAYRKPLSIKKTFTQREKKSEIKEEVKIITNEEMFSDLVVINEKIDEHIFKEVVLEEGLKKKTKKKNNKE